NGTYTVEAYYSAYPDQKATVTVEVKNKTQVTVIENPSFYPVQQNTKLEVWAPACESAWDLKFTGAVNDPDNAEEPVQCSFSRTGTTANPMQPASVLWDGVCE